MLRELLLVEAEIENCERYRFIHLRIHSTESTGLRVNSKEGNDESTRTVRGTFATYRQLINQRF